MKYERYLEKAKSFLTTGIQLDKKITQQQVMT